MKEIRATKEKWTTEQWRQRVSHELVANWKGKGRGGTRVPRSAMEVVQSSGTICRWLCSKSLAVSTKDSVATGADDMRDCTKESESDAPEHPGQCEAIRQIALVAEHTSALADFDASGSIPVMKPRLPFGCEIPFLPQSVANFLHQILGCTLCKLEELSGRGGRFDRHGAFVKDKTREKVTGGQAAVFWGTELSARRDQMMHAYEYDCDVAVFITPDCDFAAIWTSLSTYLQQFGLRCIEHTQGFKYRVCPESPLAFNEWKEFLHEATLALPGQGRPKICKKASCLKKANGLPSAPTGANCIDIELYKVHQGKPITIKGTEDLQLDPMKAFPIVEALFGRRACSNRPGAKPSVKCFVIVRWLGSSLSNCIRMSGSPYICMEIQRGHFC